jgi:hypothetical protein
MIKAKILRINCLLRHIIEGKNGREGEEEDVGSYREISGKRKDAVK